MEGRVDLAAREGREIWWYDLHWEWNPGRSHGSTMVYPRALNQSDSEILRTVRSVQANFAFMKFSHVFFYISTPPGENKTLPLPKK